MAQARPQNKLLGILTEHTRGQYYAVTHKISAAIQSGTALVDIDGLQWGNTMTSAWTLEAEKNTYATGHGRIPKGTAKA